MEGFRTYFKLIEFEILGSSLSLAWEIRLSIQKVPIYVTTRCYDTLT